MKAHDACSIGGAAESAGDVGAMVVLASLPGMGPRRLAAVLSSDDPRAALAAIRRGLRTTAAGAELADRLRGVDVGEWQRAAAALDERTLQERCRELGIAVDVDPSGLELRPGRPDPEPPVMLFRRGRRVGDQPSVAIVGTRRATGYGRNVATRLGRELAERGVTVVSGLATGIDGAAQLAALDAGGWVVGVVGSGLDVVYPLRHRTLWERLATSGTLLSEYPPGVPPARWRFPARNRIIASLADVVVVVESGASGGSMHTVESALERDRPVMAVPGPITSDASVGTNRLIAEGCSPVTAVDDVMAELGLVHPSSPAGAEAMAEERAQPLGAPAASVLDALGWEPSTPDALMARSRLTVGELHLALGELQAAAMVEERGGWWERVR